MSSPVDAHRAELTRLTKNLEYLERELKALYKMLRGVEMHGDNVSTMIAGCLERIADTRTQINSINVQLSVNLVI